MKKEIKDFRDGIFSLHSSRFGKIAEIMIQELYGFGKAQNKYHDLYDVETDQRIEVKFSKVLNRGKKITTKNVIEQCLSATTDSVAIIWDERDKANYDCNIQQVKRAEFEVLYYGLFFADRIVIFKMDSDEILSCEGYSDKQHKGNTGEGQFHVKYNTLDYHMNNHFERELTYEDLYELFENNA